jgi:hypothetical protein
MEMLKSGGISLPTGGGGGGGGYTADGKSHDGHV